MAQTSFNPFHISGNRVANHVIKELYYWDPRNQSFQIQADRMELSAHEMRQIIDDAVKKEAPHG